MTEDWKIYENAKPLSFIISALVSHAAVQIESTAGEECLCVHRFDCIGPVLALVTLSYAEAIFEVLFSHRNVFWRYFGEFVTSMSLDAVFCQTQKYSNPV